MTNKRQENGDTIFGCSQDSIPGGHGIMQGTGKAQEYEKYKEERPMKARVNDGCISCGACVAACPEVFRFNDDGVAEAYADVAPEYESTATEARDDCPVSVIDIEE